MDNAGDPVVVERLQVVFLRHLIDVAGPGPVAGAAVDVRSKLLTGCVLGKVVSSVRGDVAMVVEERLETLADSR